MEASRREKYLNALGVVQYRRRSLVVTSTVPVQNLDIGTSQPSIDETNLDGKASSDRPRANIDPCVDKVSPLLISEEPKPRSKAADILNKPMVVEDMEQALDGTHTNADAPKKLHTDLPVDINQQRQNAACGFEIMVWRVEKVLVLEFSLSEIEQTGLKHRLTNNILKALWPQNFNGAELHQHTWPMQGVASDVASAQQWLSSLVAGHRQNENSIPIWVMGDQGLKMLFPEKANSPEALSELVGTRIRHEKLGVELIISPSLINISESVVAKAQTWQLLKSIR